MRHCWTRGAWLLVVSLSLSLASSQAAAAAGWTIAKTPGLAAPSGDLQGAACVGHALCFGVGDYLTMSGVDSPLVERWNGARWEQVNVPRPAGARTISFASVSCSSGTSCIAVGSYFGSSGKERMFAERWNGAAWSTIATPKLAGFDQASLSGVSCVSGGVCIAVGMALSRSGASTPIAARWEGSQWSLLSVAEPAGTSNEWLNGVSCTSSTWCVAVGSFDGQDGEASVVVQWNGAVWSVQTTPDVGYALTAVACSSTSACTAVGGSIIRWNGTRWTLQRTLASGAWLQDVACVTAATCVAVGAGPLSSSGDDHAPQAMVWEGQTWSTERLPTPDGAADALPLTVACVSSASCVAAGHYEYNADNEYDADPGAALAYRWNGTRWTLRPVPRPLGPLPSQLSAVSCSSSTSCLAIGNYVTVAGAMKPFAELWDGGRWTFVLPPAPAGASSSELSSVDCVANASSTLRSSTNQVCFAVGGLTNTSGTYPLIERWLSGRFSIVSSPAVSTGEELSAVSCSASDACTAVGGLSFPGNTLLAERWDGHRWAIQSVATTTNSSSSSLSGVSCASMTGCTAVGTYQPSAGLNPPEATLADNWDGEWSTQETPNGPYDNQLTAVSCLTTTGCTAVGRAGSSELGQWRTPVAEESSGDAWTLESAPGQGFFSSVSCPSVSACIAVGGQGPDSFYPLTLAEQWNGSSWIIQPTPNPPISPRPGEGSATLSGVSCTSASLCVAVGSWVASDSQNDLKLPLAERYAG